MERGEEEERRREGGGKEEGRRREGGGEGEKRIKNDTASNYIKSNNTILCLPVHSSVTTASQSTPHPQ